MHENESSVQVELLEQMLDEHKRSDIVAPRPTATRGTIVEILPSGEIVVELGQPTTEQITCDILETSDNSSLELTAGDRVLVMPPEHAGQFGCVLGRIGRYQAPQQAQNAEPPQNVVIEAGELLTLKCGDSLIDLRQDGKLMIRAKDVLSRARRMNRIKGGAVSIN